MKIKKVFIICIFIMAATVSQGITVIKVPRPESKHDIRQNYYIELLKLSMEKTKNKYGDYKIERVDAGIQGRIVKLMSEGSSK